MLWDEGQGKGCDRLAHGAALPALSLLREGLPNGERAGGQDSCLAWDVGLDLLLEGARGCPPPATPLRTLEHTGWSTTTRSTGPHSRLIQPPGLFLGKYHAPLSINRTQAARDCLSSLSLYRSQRHSRHRKESRRRIISDPSETPAWAIFTFSHSSETKGSKNGRGKAKF